MKSLKNCLACGAKLVKDSRDMPFTYKGKELIIQHVKGLYCTGCDEVIIDKTDIIRVDQQLQAFSKKVNTELVNPEFIRLVREKLGLGRTEAGDLLGGGKNSFNRYEAGEATPPVALVKLLHILNKHPELLAEVRAS